jgi:threonine aldolase
MRHAMAHAVVGDDVFNDCPTTKNLQKQVAELFGKQDALFVPSGTQSNLISSMVICHQRTGSLVIGDKSHLANYERGGMATVGHIWPTILPNEPDGTIGIDAIKGALPVM